MEGLNSFGCYQIHGADCMWYAISLAKGKVHSDAWLVELPGGPNIGEWYRLRIDVVGDEISFYIDDDLQHQRNDKLHSSGGVNMYAYNAIVEFDNVVITGDDIPDGDPSGYAVEPEARLATTWGAIKR